jgi:Xaa-Pro dipeptidase
MVAENYEAVLKGKYPGKAHAKRVVDLIRKDIPDANGIIYLESQLTRMMEDSDEPEPFRCVIPAPYLYQDIF